MPAFVDRIFRIHLSNRKRQQKRITRLTELSPIFAVPIMVWIQAITYLSLYKYRCLLGGLRDYVNLYNYSTRLSLWPTWPTDN